MHSNKKPPTILSGVFVPGTGFEPAHPFERRHLKTVRLPISPPGLHLPGGLQNYLFDLKWENFFEKC